MWAAVILRALIWWAAEEHLSHYFFNCSKISTFPPVYSLRTPRINHNERLEFLGDAVVEFLTRWESVCSSLIDTTANWSRLQHNPPPHQSSFHTHFSLSLTVCRCLSQPHSSPYFPLIQDSDLLVIGNLFSPFTPSLMTWNSPWQLAISCLRLLSGMLTVLLTPRWARTPLPSTYLSALLIIRSYYWSRTLSSEWVPTFLLYLYLLLWVEENIGKCFSNTLRTHTHTHCEEEKLIYFYFSVSLPFAQQHNFCYQNVIRNTQC